jgi:hypothetical protein
MPILKVRRLAVLAGGLIPLVLSAGLSAAPTGVPRPADTTASIVEPTQGIYFGYGRPYRPYYGYRPYRPYYGYRPYYYAPPPPPPPVYYETRPYVVRPAPRRWHPDDVARCASQFRSFNVHTGTYITYGGEERLCPYLR